MPGKFRACHFLFWGFKKIFFIKLYLICNVPSISAVQQRDSVICVYTYSYTYSFFHAIFHHVLIQEIGHSFLCCTVGPQCLSIPNVAVCFYASQTPHLFPSLPVFLESWELWARGDPTLYGVWILFPFLSFSLWVVVKFLLGCPHWWRTCYISRPAQRERGQLFHVFTARL